MWQVHQRQLGGALGVNAEALVNWQSWQSCGTYLPILNTASGLVTGKDSV